MAPAKYHQVISNFLKQMTSPIQRDTNVGKLPASNQIPRYGPNIDSHLPYPPQNRGIHEFAGYHHRKYQHTDHFRGFLNQYGSCAMGRQGISVHEMQFPSGFLKCLAI
jgi:hypothetical protein